MSIAINSHEKTDTPKRTHSPLIGVASQESLRIRTGKPDWQPMILSAKPKTLAVPRQNPKSSIFVPAYTADQLAIIADALRSDADANAAIITRFKLTVRRADVQTLAGRNWLNDAVINFYMRLLMERSKLHTTDANAQPRLMYVYSIRFSGQNSTRLTAMRPWRPGRSMSISLLTI